MKTILVGFDAFDPVIFEKLHSEGKTPNLSKYIDAGGYSRFQVTNPSQSEVSWTSIATGMNPGEHGIFDFVHRNPANYGRQVSLLPTKTGVLGRQFIPPHNAKTIFNAAVEDGFPAVSMWWPATFPARLESPVKSIPGLGTPDIFGKLGVGLFYAMEDRSGENDIKTQVLQLTQIRKDQFRSEIKGPSQMTLTGLKDAGIHFDLEILSETQANFKIDKQTFALELGKWSPVIELTFKIGFGVSIKAVTRVILNQIKPGPGIYFVPLQLHPLRSPWPYGTTKRFLKDVWKNLGPYLTLGWPQDTTSLEDGFITDEQFLDLCNSIRIYRERTLMRMIDSFEEGVLACVFDSLDRVQHMFLRDRPDVIESWYIELDSLFGRIQDRVMKKPGSDEIHLMMVSDHGFGEFAYKVNLNRWLVNRGYLSEKNRKESGNLGDVNWEESRAYAVGLNSVYLNIKDRESIGIISPEDIEKNLQTIKDDLLQWIGPDGQTVIQNIQTQDQAFQGPYSEYGPDLVIGYRPKYRASAETGLGQWSEDEIEENKDHWGADHCFDPTSVPGVIFSNKGFEDITNPSYRDIPMLTIGKAISQQRVITPPVFSDEDEDAVEERLKGLGYL
jgi:predicted AlkP superfamily phosphohydrolase/phosphomutase